MAFLMVSVPRAGEEPGAAYFAMIASVGQHGDQWIVDPVEQPGPGLRKTAAELRIRHAPGITSRR